MYVHVLWKFHLNQFPFSCFTFQVSTSCLFEFYWITSSTCKRKRIFWILLWKEMKKEGKCSWEIKSNSGVLLSLITTRVRSISLTHLLLFLFDFQGNTKCWGTFFFPNQIWDSGNNILVLHCKQAQRKKWLLPSQSTNDINLIV